LLDYERKGTTMKTYTVETKAQYLPGADRADYTATTKADAVKKARDYYNRFCKETGIGRITYRVVAIDGVEC
jgi:hypothetical protein